MPDREKLSIKEEVLKNGGNYVHRKLRPGTKLKVIQVSDEQTTDKIVLRVRRGTRIRVKNI